LSTLVTTGNCCAAATATKTNNATVRMQEL
jgi:hypothetical protein